MHHALFALPQVRHSALRLVKLASEAAAGVAHLHAHGIIHRDLACRNLLVDEGASSVAVADFGFARLRAKVCSQSMKIHTYLHTVRQNDESS
jgi:tRNA A-37 threonylcarbamoyl transferase component Bud32